MLRTNTAGAIGISTPAFLFTFLLAASGSPARAQNLGGWSEPLDGWDYVYFADEDEDEDGEFTGAGGSLDGTWTHNNGSDAWDGSGPGDPFRPDGFTQAAPGGAGILLRKGLAEDGTDAFVLGVVDIGNPSAAGVPEPSNRKMWFCHDVSQDQGGAVNGAGVLGTGLTIIARYRLMPDQDPQTPGWQLMDGGIDDDASQGAAPGYALRDGGKGGIGFYDTGLDRIFSLAPFGTTGFQLPPEVPAGAAPANFLDVGDNTIFHTFWITIEAGTLADRFRVAIYLDGALEPAKIFENMQFGDDTDCDGISHLHMGFHSTPQKGAFEVDYFGYKTGIEEPFSECPGGFTCRLDGDTGKVIGTWSEGAAAGAFRIERDGALLLDNLPATATGFEDPNPPRPGATYRLVSLVGGEPRAGCNFPQCTVATVICPGNLDCSPDRSTGEVTLNWTAGKFLTVSGYQIKRDGAVVGTPPAGATSFKDTGVSPGEHTYELAAQTDPAGACSEAPFCITRVYAPSIPEICDQGWLDAGLNGDAALVTTDDGKLTLFFPDGVSADCSDTATLVIDVAALPGGVREESFPIELLVRYDNNLLVENTSILPPAAVGFALSRTGVSTASDGVLQEAVAQVAGPPSPTFTSEAFDRVITQDVKLPLIVGRNVIELSAWLDKNPCRQDPPAPPGGADDPMQLLCLRIGPFAAGLEATVAENPCASGLTCVRNRETGAVALTWRAGVPHEYLILRDGSPIANLPLGMTTSFDDAAPEPGFHTYTLEVLDDDECPILTCNGGGGTPDALGFIREWLILGPLDWQCPTAAIPDCAAPPSADIEDDFIIGTAGAIPVDQTSIEPTEGMELTLGPLARATGIRTAARTELNPKRPGTGTWFAYQSPDPQIDYNIVFGADPGNDFVTYAVTYIENLAAGPLPLNIGVWSDDSVEVYINDAPVWLNSIPRGIGPADGPHDHAPVTLARGTNRVLVKVFEGGGDTGFRLRFEERGLENPVIDELIVSLAPRTEPPPVVFKRGDTDVNGNIEITDPINLLGFLFLGDPQPPCFDSADADDNGSLEITDAIVSLGFQFLGEAAPPAPGPLVCGPDPTTDPQGADYGCDYPAASCQ